MKDLAAKTERENEEISEKDHFQKGIFKVANTFECIEYTSFPSLQIPEIWIIKFRTNK